MTIVIDATVAIAWCLRDRKETGGADSLMERTKTEAAIVPGLFWHEVRNVLVVAERKKRSEPNTAECHVQRLRGLPLGTDNGQDDGQTIAMARRHGLSGYDAAYMETAKRRGAKLATLDRKLAAAADDEGISLSID